jgi:selenide,water dikinase
MRSGATPVLKDLVLIGGGHSHVGVLRSFGMEPMPGVRLTLISSDVQAPYSGMLPGLIAGHYTFDEAHIELMPLARFAGARFLHDEVVGVDLQAKTVRFRERPPLPFDVLSINIGATPGLRVEGAAGSVVPVKPIGGFWRRWEVLRDRCLARRDDTHIGVVGGGAGGVEVLLAVQYRLRELLAGRHRSASHLRFHLATASDEILPTHNERVRAKFRRVLGERSVNVLTDHEVVRVERLGTTESAGGAGTPGAAAISSDSGGGEDGAGEPAAPADLDRPYRLHFARGHLDVDEVLWVTTARGADWPGNSGLETDEGGFIKVDEALRSLSHPDVFAAGDIAAVVDHPRPKAGVFAVRQAPLLAENLRLRLLHEEPRPFRPQREFLSLISTGDRYAIASRGVWALEGRWVWRWKDGIDRRFMARYNELPEMEAAAAGDGEDGIDPRLLDDAAAAELANAGTSTVSGRPLPGVSDTSRALAAISTLAMRCGGCGAKVGATVLERVLSRLQPVGRDDVVVGLDAPDDAAVVEVPSGKQLVQTVDFFPAFIEDPYVFGKVAANHALGDVFAMGAEPQAALAVVTVGFGLEAKVEADLTQLLAGALAVLNAAGTTLAGGHTSEAAELALGFAVSGLVDRGRALGKGGLRPGDLLVLSKPLGTGALFAAEMRGAAKGRWIAAALSSMTQSNGAAARCLVEHGATAMTDVTGFGLLGHLVEMTRASGTDAAIDLDAVPALDGALEVIERGIVSSLQAENVRLRRAIAGAAAVAGRRKYPLLFDPQTAGGLLAGVPRESAEACVDALRAAGYGRAAIVGRVEEAGRADAPIRLLP